MEIKNAEFIFVTEDTERFIRFQEDNFKAKVIHKNSALFNEEATLYVLEFPSGVRIDVLQSSKIKGDEYAVRLNVDNLEEVLSLYVNTGCEIAAGPVEIPSAKAALIKSPGGRYIVLMEHLQD